MHTIEPSSDAAVVADLIRRAFAGVAERLGLTAGDWGWHPANWTPEKVRQAMDEGVCFHVLSCGQRPCGCVGINKTGPGVCKLRRLAVLPEFQRRGLGRALVRYGLARAAELGARRVEIGIIDEDPGLKGWYTRLGFTVTEEAVRHDRLPFTVTRMAAAVGPAAGTGPGEPT